MQEFDAIIIGSGFGGAMTAKKLMDAGWKVLMLERGDWVSRGPQNWASNASVDLTPHYDRNLPYQVLKGGNKKSMGVYSCVGGPSVFYGGVSFRFREQDFHPPTDIIADSKAHWPIDYSDLSAYYDEAESLLQISGQSGIDPTEPKRIKDFPQKAFGLSEVSTKLKNSAQSLGLHPFHLPLAINYEDKNRRLCELCTTCDTFACAVEAKNDLPSMLLGHLVSKGLVLLPKTMAVKLEYANSKITSVSCINTQTGKANSLSAKYVILSAGALASPHLLLASGLDQVNPGGQVIGRYLMRHVNAIVFGIFPGKIDREERFHKELCILDFYFGHKKYGSGITKLGSLQQVPTPPAGLVENELPWPLGKMLSPAVKLLTGLLAIAEDQPNFENYIKIDSSRKGKYQMPVPFISHQYSDRDKKAIKLLITESKTILKKMGAWLHYVHHIRTFSHAVGTVRMGDDPQSSALNKNCKFRGLNNLFVVDGSFMPTAAALNPSLTIGANALRVGEYIGTLL